MCKGDFSGCASLDGHEVSAIRSDLRAGNEEDLSSNVLNTNKGFAFKGVDFGGAGFLLSEKEVSKIKRQHADELRFVSLVLNADNFNSSPSLLPHRHIINFGSLDYKEASRAEFCFEMVRTRVKPGRDKKKGKEKSHWWLV